MLAGASLTEESVERIITTADGLVTGHLAIWLDAMLKAEKLPASIANLHASLTNVKTKSLAHGCKKQSSRLKKWGEVQAKSLKGIAWKSVA